jgi:site-specific recombinase XerD
MAGTARTNGRAGKNRRNMDAITQSELTLSEPLPLDQNAAAVYIASLPAETGRRTQAQALRVVAQAIGTDLDRLNWGALRYQHTAAIRARIAQSYSPASANKIFSALRQTLKQAWLLGQMTAEEYSRAIELELVTGETLPAGRELSTGEILAFMTTCQKDTNTNAGTRDAAIIALMYAAGLRRDEVVKLGVENYDPETGKMVLMGKRNKQRIAYVTNGAADALQDWLTIRRDESDPLFVAINKGGRLDPSKAITFQAIYNMLAKHAQEAALRTFPLTICEDRLSLTCWQPVQTLRQSPRWQDMRTSRLPPAMTADQRKPNGKRQSYCTCLMRATRSTRSDLAWRRVSSDAELIYCCQRGRSYGTKPS